MYIPPKLCDYQKEGGKLRAFFISKSDMEKEIQHINLKNATESQKFQKLPQKSS